VLKEDKVCRGRLVLQDPQVHKVCKEVRGYKVLREYKVQQVHKVCKEVKGYKVHKVLKVR